MVSAGDLKDMCFGLDAWKNVLGIFLRRWDDNKPKPMRMLLRSLSNLISRDPIPERRFAKKEYAVRQSLLIIDVQNESVSVKPAFQVLDHLISKNLVDATDILRVLAVHDGVQTPSSPVYSLDRPQSSEATDLSNPEWKHSQKDFFFAILNLYQYSVISADSCRLVGKFTQSFHALSNATSWSHRPIWASPLQRFMQKHPESLEATTNHVLPVLFKTDHNDALRFLQRLPWENLRNGDIGDLSDADIVLCLLTANFAAEVQHSDRSGKSQDLVSSVGHWN